jgi:GAF domain-containing protein
MNQYDGFIPKLRDLSIFLEKQTDLDESLHELTAMAADILDSENCSIMLFKEEENGGAFRLRVSAHSGDLPEKSFDEAMKLNEGISGHVAATRKSLLIEDIEHSQFCSVARRHYHSKSFISAPVLINEKVVGVIHVNTPQRGRIYNKKDLNLLNIIALLVGKSIQIIQLRKLIDSRYTIFAMAQENKGELTNIIASVGQDLDKVVKLLAKTFYREMSKAGFSTNHIINAASEIIMLLTENVAKHKKRFQRNS